MSHYAIMGLPVGENAFRLQQPPPVEGGDPHTHLETLGGRVSGLRRTGLAPWDGTGYGTMFRLLVEPGDSVMRYGDERWSGYAMLRGDRVAVIFIVTKQEWQEG